MSDSVISALNPATTFNTNDEIAISQGLGLGGSPQTNKVSLAQLDTRWNNASDVTAINAQLNNAPKDSFISTIMDASRRIYNFLIKGNITNTQSPDHFFYIAGDPDVDGYWKSRLAAVFRLSAIGAYIDHKYSGYGQISPGTGNSMKLSTNPSGVTIGWDNGFGGHTNYWYDIAPGDFIVNTSKSQFAKIALWGNLTLNVTNASDISTWQIHDNVMIVSGVVSGLFHFFSGWQIVFDSLAYSLITIRSSANSNKLRFQSQDRIVKIYGKMGATQGLFDVYDVSASDTGVLLQAGVNCYNASTTYGNLLYTWTAPQVEGTYTEQDFKYMIIELRPQTSAPIDIEYIETFTIRVQDAANGTPSQEYMCNLASIAVAQNDAAMIQVCVRSIKNMIYNNQLYATGTPNRPWSDDYYRGNPARLDTPMTGVGAFTETTYSSNPVYAIFRNQPTQTRTGFAMADLGKAYISLKPFLNNTDLGIFQQSIIAGARYLKGISCAFHTYTTNADLFFYISLLYRHQVAIDLSEATRTYTLNGAISTTSQTTISWVSVTGMEIGDMILVDSEWMGISQIDFVGLTTIVVRNCKGTTASTHLTSVVGTMATWKQLADSIWYNLINGDVGTTNQQWFRYLLGNGSSEETDIAFGCELPSSTTTTANLLNTDTVVQVSSASNLGFISGNSYINQPIDLQVKKTDGTYEYVQGYSSAGNTISIVRGLYGSTPDTNALSGAIIGRFHDWGYVRIIPGLLAWAYFLAKQYGSTDANAIRKMAKATQRLAEYRLDFTTGEYISSGGSRLSGGGAAIAQMGSIYGILHAMDEGIDYYKLSKFYDVYAKAEVNQFGFIADAERGTGSDNANRELGAPAMGFLYSVPIAIRLYNSNINT